MLRVLAIDDEVPALDELAYLLREDARVEHVATASDGATALRDMVEMIGRGERLDGIFLDIRMPGLSGLELGRLIGGFPDPPRLVFVTAHEEWAVKAFELEAVDYLLKPVRSARLAEAVRRLSIAVGRAAEPDSEEVIPVELGGHTRFVALPEVLFAEAQGDYVRLHTATDNYLLRASLATLERQWADFGFIRVHRSTLVSTRHVKELYLEAGRIVLKVGEHTVPVSRRHSRQVREQLIGQANLGGSPLRRRPGPRP
jgi:two-component system, LytTR family, response regulator LytT